MLAFTSGTTGEPKATMHFHRDVLANADTFSHYVLKPTTDDVFTGTPPIAFTFGLGGLVVFPLRVGASTLLIEKATPDQLADLIEAHGVTICFTAPTAYRAIIASGKAATDPHAAPGASRPASTFPSRRGTPSRRPPASSSSTGSARRRCSTSSSARPTRRSARDRPASRSRATAPRSSTSSATTSPTASRAVWRSRDRRAAGISPTSARRRTSRTAGTSPATPSSATPTATSGTRPAATT